MTQKNNLKAIADIVLDVWNQETKNDLDLSQFDFYFSSITAYGYSETDVRAFAEHFNIGINPDIYDIDDESFVNESEIVKGALTLDKDVIERVKAEQGKGKGQKLPAHFYCKTCKKEVDFEFVDELKDCTTPVGVIRDVYKKAICKDCHSVLKSRELDMFNQVQVQITAMGVWRIKNPKGTPKQCHKALGTPKTLVDKFWDICMDNLDIAEIQKNN